MNYAMLYMSSTQFSSQRVYRSPDVRPIQTQTYVEPTPSKTAAEDLLVLFFRELTKSTTQHALPPTTAPEPEKKEEKLLLSVKEAALLCDVSESTIRKWIRDEPGFPVLSNESVRRILIPKKQLEKWIDKITTD